MKLLLVSVLAVAGWGSDSGLMVIPESRNSAISSVAAADLSPYSGEYRGIMRSDASPIGHGEVEIRIEKGTLKAWIATGERIDIQERPWSEFIPLSGAETSALFRAGSPYPGRVAAFRSSLNRWPMKILFLRDPVFERGEFAAMLRHDLFDTMLLGPTQISHGDFEKLLKATENQFGKGRLPRLYSAGKAPSGEKLDISGAAIAGVVAARRAREAAQASPEAQEAELAEMEVRYRKEAEMGTPEAQHNLAVVLNARKKHQEAVKWYQRASEQGLASSQKNLGSSYLQGLGVAKDSVMAYMYYLLAARNGASGMNESLAKLRSSLSADQVREAERRAAARRAGRPRQ